MTVEGSEIFTSEICATVRLERDGRCATVWIERPPLNILDLETLEGLDGAFEQLGGIDGLQMVTVRGGGERAFSAGVAIEDHVGERIPAMLETFHRALRRLFSLEAPTVAAVDGHCLGGGMELAAVCDLVVATERSTFGQPEIKLACFAPVAAALYPVLFGPSLTYDLLLTGRTLDSREAEAKGFLARRVPDGGLDEALEQLRGELSSQSAVALKLCKKAIRLGQPQVELIDRALTATEDLYLDELAKTSDMEEGVAAFMEKRAPAWLHR